MTVPLICRWDLRVPGLDAAGRAEVYQRMLAQAAYADEHLFAISVSEHHQAEDGYLPSPIPVAAALAAVTTKPQISIAAILANFYDPVRLAEDMSVLSHLSAGRINYTVALGYRREEYEHFGLDWTTRGREIEERLIVLLDLLAGRSVTWRGHHAQLQPPPYAPPVLFYGGGGEAAARRAGRLGLHFQPQVRDPQLREIYRAAAHDAGHKPGMTLVPPPGPATIFCHEDPDEFWERYGTHLLADAAGYERWRDDSTHAAPSLIHDASADVRAMREAGVYVVWTPDDLISRCRSGEVQAILTHPACGALPSEPSWHSLRLICEQVLPALAGSQR